jgi:hypothetical protein
MSGDHRTGEAAGNIIVIPSFLGSLYRYRTPKIRNNADCTPSDFAYAQRSSGQADRLDSDGAAPPVADILRLRNQPRSEISNLTFRC